MAGKPFALLGINSDADRKALQKTTADEQITWRSWWDDGSIEGPIHKQWQIVQRPAIHLLDANGIIRYKNIPPEDVDQAIEGLLDELDAKNPEQGN